MTPNINEEIRRRIRLSVAAYAYEVHNDSVMSDGEFDKECLLVDLSVSTGNRKLDNFFKKNFGSDAGTWRIIAGVREEWKQLETDFVNSTAP